MYRNSKIKGMIFFKEKDNMTNDLKFNVMIKNCLTV